jgi:lipopolysaccharide export LptBFGC system permease protein LptF
MVASLESILLLVCALLGAALGVWFSRQAGLRPAWIFGAACGVALAIVLFAVASLPALGALRSVVL